MIKVQKNQRENPNKRLVHLFLTELCQHYWKKEYLKAVSIIFILSGSKLKITKLFEKFLNLADRLLDCQILAISSFLQFLNEVEDQVPIQF